MKRTQHLTSPFIASILLLLIVLLLAVPKLHAATAVNLYSTSALLLNNSAVLRKKAVKTGLSEVLVRASGGRAVLENALVKQALADADAYIYQYSYESTDETITILGAKTPAVRLLVDFSPTNVKELLNRANITLWSPHRPEVLLWLTADEKEKDRGRQLLEANSTQVKVFKKAALSYGLPLSSPLLDLQDRQELSASRLWAMDDGAILRASSRYPMDAVLAGRIRQQGGEQPWRGDFIVLYQGNSHYLTAEAKTSMAIAKQITEATSAYFSGLSLSSQNPQPLQQSQALGVEQDGVQKSQPTRPTLTILVDNISNYARYNEVIDYVGELPVVDEVLVAGVKGQQMRLEIIYNGALSALKDILERSEQLQTMPSITVDTQLLSVFSWR